MKILNIIIAVSLIWLLVSFWHRDDLPGDVRVLPALTEEPSQTGTGKLPFDAEYNGINYRVEPQFEYELSGMIVSYRHHEGDSRMHSQAGDHLNMLDVCVVWGDNASNPLIHQIDFWNGIFTCNVQTRNQEAWDSFDMYQLSNNHLISDDDLIRRQVRKISVGDQIRVRGYLASYGNEGGGKRGTSTTRLDSGDGACETIYVEQFQILQAATNYWHLSMYASLVIFLLASAVHFRRPYRPYSSNAS